MGGDIAPLEIGIAEGVGVGVAEGVGVGVAEGVEGVDLGARGPKTTGLLQISFFPDLTHVYCLDLWSCVLPSVLQDLPGTGAAALLDGRASKEPARARTTKYDLRRTSQ